MSRSTYPATESNLATLQRYGLQLPAGLTQAIAELSGGLIPTDDPVAELRARLKLSTGGNRDSDSQSPALCALASKLTHTQVWDVLREEGADSFDLRCYLSVAMRNGLLPHDSRLVNLFRPTDIEPLRLEALRAAFAEARYSFCDSLCEQYTKGELTEQDMAEVGHADCVPLTRDTVFTQVRAMDLPATERLSLLFNRDGWHRQPGPRASADPTKVVSDDLLAGMHAMLADELSTLTPYSGPWVQTVKDLMGHENRKSGSLTDQQALTLLDENPGLAADLLVAWLGNDQRDRRREVLMRHELPFMVYAWEIHEAPIQQWLHELATQGHPSIAVMDVDQLESLGFESPGVLAAVPWGLRKQLLAKHVRWLTGWLASTSDIDEVRDLTRDGTLDSGLALYGYTKASAVVRAELLDTPGFPAALAELLGRRWIATNDAGLLAAVLDGVLDLMPADEKLRARLMTRILTATSDGKGPLDGKARLRQGMQVLLDRWAARSARLHDQG